jgi:hypothetical protein
LILWLKPASILGNLNHSENFVVVVDLAIKKYYGFINLKRFGLTSDAWRWGA